MNNKPTNKKMSYLDKIKNNKQKVNHHKKKIKENKAIPEINIVKVNGNATPQKENQNDNKESKDDPMFSISITAPKKNEKKSIAGSSDRSLKVSKDNNSHKELFGKKNEEMKFDSDKELSDKETNIKISVTKPKKSHFGHKKKPSKSQRDTLKIAIQKESGAKSHRGLKTPGNKQCIN